LINVNKQITPDSCVVIEYFRVVYSVFQFFGDWNTSKNYTEVSSLHKGGKKVNQLAIPPIGNLFHETVCIPSPTVCKQCLLVKFERVKQEQN